MTAKTRMQRQIMGHKFGRNVYRYSIPAQDPENTDGWTPSEKLLWIVLRRRSNELGTGTFELSEGEVAGLMDSELAKLTAALTTGHNLV
jgi:hypothetical protein